MWYRDIRPLGNWLRSTIRTSQRGEPLIQFLQEPLVLSNPYYLRLKKSRLFLDCISGAFELVFALVILSMGITLVNLLWNARNNIVIDWVELRYRGCGIFMVYNVIVTFYRMIIIQEMDAHGNRLQWFFRTIVQSKNKSKYKRLHPSGPQPSGPHPSGPQPSGPRVRWGPVQIVNL